MNDFQTLKKVITLTLTVGVLPFVFFTHAHELTEPKGETPASAEVQKQPADNPGSGETNRKSEFTYGAKATLQTTYLWRGLYAGGANIQASANVGYYGFYADMWWNIGVTDWRFNTFLPEVDITLGFSRWGLNVFILYIHNFDCGFFDFANYAYKGNRLELNARYTISQKIPLTFAWATRVGASDGYFNEKGELVQAYSSYAEISYTQALPYDLALFGAVGISPWRSIYSFYERQFVVSNIELRLIKKWNIGKHTGVSLQGQISLNPSALAKDMTTSEWHPYEPFRQSVNANIGTTIFLQ